ncbi:hypothetical protein HWB99_gp045 [Mycobacterium phage DrLupo]|uniref:Uncharacterized protein n=1 Tax=Mycobacterium phage DrLupo TaxID=2499037 RepID=A0A3S9UQL5_9CAUD|nr:hypothetical protein HWB99_gp045 [Mycobacterium phage DrLupo]AZS12581.1 hypothetical protein SEA_DRLUPO_45 [Mycobacterium phage DrLupo]
MLGNLLDFDASDFLSLLVGFFLALFGEPIWCFVRNKMDGKHRKVKMPTAKQIIYVLILAGVLWSLWSTNQIQHEITKNSRQALVTSEAVCEEQKLRALENQAGQKLFFEGVFNVPADIKTLPPEDPRKVAWGQNLVNEYLNTFKYTNDRRAQLAEEFRTNPPTEPRCGIAG